MRITMQELEEMTARLLSTLARERVQTAQDLERLAGSTFPTAEGERVEVLMRPSNFGTYACTTSYVKAGTGIPLEVRINSALDYSQIILKADGRVRGYEVFGEDSFGNVVQYRILHTIAWDDVRSRVAELTET